jgi:cyclophilin family peptidyl-prolyl cis-trans isomerase
LPSSKTRLAISGFLLLAASFYATASAQVVRFHTNAGDIDVTLLPDAASKTVANFLNYANRGAFNNSIIHRSVPGFIFQGGGYQLQNHLPVAIPQDAAVRNEFKISNTRGTLSMAKLGTDPNSATNQWFFNEADNSKNLDNQNGGFTVFGKVANAAGLSIMDKISNVRVYDAGSPFDALPLMNYNGTLQDQNFVTVISITVIANLPSVSANGIIAASNFGGFAGAAAGSFIEIYGSSLAGTTRQWAAGDFVNGNAPTSLDGVSVTVDNQPAYVYSISPNQVNVQVPSNISSSGMVPVVVKYNGQTSAPVMLTVNPVQPGILAPPHSSWATSSTWPRFMRQQEPSWATATSRASHQPPPLRVKHSSCMA